MKSPPGIDPRIGEPDDLDVFEMEQTLALGERVNRMDATGLPGGVSRLLLLNKASSAEMPRACTVELHAG